jgi:hypothetical protein
MLPNLKPEKLDGSQFPISTHGAFWRNIQNLLDPLPRVPSATNFGSNCEIRNIGVDAMKPVLENKDMFSTAIVVVI